MHAHLQCSICQDLFHGNVLQCSRGHSFCKSCIETWIARQRTCPTCRDDLSLPLQRNTVAEHALEQDTPCPNSGCKLKFKVSDSRKHAEVCEHRIVTCRSNSAVKGCTWKGRQIMRKKHRQDCIWVICDRLRRELAAARVECAGLKRVNAALRERVSEIRSLPPSFTSCRRDAILDMQADMPEKNRVPENKTHETEDTAASLCIVSETVV